eukprot:m.82580 g.82580  ORF g.82580 m.82580 type:complete len:420 (-) comp21059_c0_seq1:4177-5436(-)
MSVVIAIALICVGLAITCLLIPSLHETECDSTTSCLALVPSPREIPVDPNSSVLLSAETNLSFARIFEPRDEAGSVSATTASSTVRVTNSPLSTTSSNNSSHSNSTSPFDFALNSTTVALNLNASSTLATTPIPANSSVVSNTTQSRTMGSTPTTVTPSPMRCALVPTPSNATKLTNSSSNGVNSTTSGLCSSVSPTTTATTSSTHTTETTAVPSFSFTYQLPLTLTLSPASLLEGQQFYLSIAGALYMALACILSFSYKQFQLSDRWWSRYHSCVISGLAGIVCVCLRGLVVSNCERSTHTFNALVAMLVICVVGLLLFVHATTLHVLWFVGAIIPFALTIATWDPCGIGALVSSLVTCGCLTFMCYHGVFQLRPSKITSALLGVGSFASALLTLAFAKNSCSPVSAMFVTSAILFGC